MSKKLYILGTRGIPAQHGGFETFAEKLSLYLANQAGTLLFIVRNKARATFTSLTGKAYTLSIYPLLVMVLHRLWFLTGKQHIML